MFGSLFGFSILIDDLTLCRFLLRGQGENVVGTVRLSACSARLCPFPFALSHATSPTMCSMAQAYSYPK